MNRAHFEELLSRDLDGDLPPAEQARLRAAEAADPSLAALRADWQRVGQALRDLPVPGTPDPEVAWQDVRRALRLSRPAEVSRPLFGWRLAWAGAALALLLVVFGLLPRNAPPAAAPALAAVAPRDVEVEFVETDLPDASTMVYQDEESGWTIVWVAAAEPVAPSGQDT